MFAGVELMGDKAECFVKGWLASIGCRAVRLALGYARDRGRPLSKEEKDILLDSLNRIEEAVSGCIDRKVVEIIRKLRGKSAKAMLIKPSGLCST
jgi:hypothetical protein